MTNKTKMYTKQEFKSGKLAIHVKNQKEYNKLMKRLERAGFDIDEVNNGYWQTSPDTYISYRAGSVIKLWKAMGRYTIIRPHQLNLEEDMKEEPKYITTHKQLLTCDKKKINCKFNGKHLNANHIEVEDNKIFIAHDNISKEERGIFGRWCISSYENKYENNGRHVTEIQLVETMKEENTTPNHGLVGGWGWLGDIGYDEEPKGNWVTTSCTLRAKEGTQVWALQNLLQGNQLINVECPDIVYSMGKDEIESKSKTGKIYPCTLDFVVGWSLYKEKPKEDWKGMAKSLLEGTEFEVKEGSRMWAFEMLDKGEKLINRKWTNEDGYIYLDDEYLYNDKEEEMSENFNWFKDGWELYKEEPKTIKTMILREAIENEIGFILKGLVSYNDRWIVENGILYYNDDGCVCKSYNLGYIIKNLDIQVEKIKKEE